ncbi:MAG: DAK2 domain-containing protein [Clostridiales bacterium]|jgi:DAK2 domain fusion protein YloV|nr:DAK2 domain-containing protein [Clostridiales bacterium]MCI2160843.1 DAK2 domain-containing protein [Oscillospiraceae bacterium]CAB1241468.1 Dihydroxyacetone kinase [Ruminococcaceae bacterium BL-4]MCI1961740.1 DAK2 domain-containing protein [Clostridiales bacterium]MCI2021851.1 DAK2 domain-containing protein [Clostridiales bacterium]
MINGTDLRNAMISAANNIAKHKSSIDKLNIFPVPDGDTGTNMSMTIGNAAAELEKVTEEKTAGEVAHIAASALLRGARGNSGVILSLLFRGFSKGTEGMDTLGGSDLVNALGIGVEAAYKAVMKPAEGTILTVSRVACEKGKAAAAIDDDPVYVWSAVCKGAAEALENTPELLPVLKKAGVVDAGGKGLCYIFEGMMSVFRDGVIIENDGDEEEKSASASLSDDFFRNAAAEFDQEIHYTYCTEFIVGRNPEIQKDPEELRTFLETMGDCVVVVSDDEIIKVHVHTEDPGNALEAALVFGQLLTVKVDNMKEQHRKAQATEAAKKEELKNAELKSVEPTEEIGFISVAAGEGLATLFKDLGCTHVVSGGQTMNPSTEDILEAVKATPAKNVMILPNNKNIIMAAEQCIPLVTDRKVIVLPTRTIPQGLSAMLSYDPESTTEENSVKMMEAAGNVNTGMVTFAARDSEFGGHKMKQGDILGLENGKMKLIEKDYVHTCSKLTRSMVNRATSFITIIYGQDVTEEQANDAYNRIKSHVSSDIEVTLVNGGQPVYYFIISVE